MFHVRVDHTVLLQQSLLQQVGHHPKQLANELIIDLQSTRHAYHDLLLAFWLDADAVNCHCHSAVGVGTAAGQLRCLRHSPAHAECIL
jgi:hypothetical protein